MIKSRVVKPLLIVIFVLVIVTPYVDFFYTINFSGNNFIGNMMKSKKYRRNSMEITNFINGRWRNLSDKQKNNLSILGRMLFLGEPPPLNNTTSKQYKILIWKHGLSLQRRHINHFTNNTVDPFQRCSVQNCNITYSDVDLQSADLVLFHLHRTKSIAKLPHDKRILTQIWAFLTDESPFNTFMYKNDNILQYYDGYFNWSMSYRMESDIPVPYGRTIFLDNETRYDTINIHKWNNNKKQDVLIAIMGSNCGGRNHRWEYVRELRKHIRVDVYGQCGNLKCPGHFTSDCSKISRYKFYLSFENSNCDEYITEKVWWNCYNKDAIPIVMGGSTVSYQQILPPGSYLNVDDFATPGDLANFIRYLNNTPSEFEQYFRWKRYFKVLNEHGYFQSVSVHYCRICEALNYNSKKKKVYTDLQQFLDTKKCHRSWMSSKNTHY